MRTVGLALRLLVTSQTVIGDPVELHGGRIWRRLIDDDCGEMVKGCVGVGLVEAERLDAGGEDRFVKD